MKTEIFRIKILEVSVPMLPVVELKTGVEEEADKKMIPGLVY